MFQDLTKIREYLLEAGPPQNIKDSRELRLGAKRITNIRLDWECPENTSWVDSVDGMLESASVDLMDMLINGDVTGDDVLLRNFDGLRKRDKYFADLRITQFRLFREYKPQKSMYEYVLYMVLYVDWDEAK